MAAIRTLLILFVGIYCTSTGAAPQDTGGSLVNPQLLSFHQQFATPTLQKMSNRVYGAFAFEYSNFTFIEGDDGVIVVDTGWYRGGMTRALAEFRKISNKPVVALMYTHSHVDHTGASEVLLAEAGESPIEVYAPSNWQHYLNYSLSPLRPMVIRRAFGQMGMLLPRGENGTVGAGVGPNPGMDGEPALVIPTVEVDQRTAITIAGVDLELIPTAGDIPEHMMVWLPEERVLLSGDLLGGTFPYVESARYEPDRDPAAMASSLDLALSLKPQSVVPGHGRLLMGDADVTENLVLNRDLIQYLVDQVDRLVVQGLNADQLVESFTLPKVFAEHPDLQPHYHRIEWMLRGMFMKRAGWNGDIVDLVGLGERRESAKLIELLGGTAPVLDAVRDALAKGEIRWAAGLADKVLQVDPDNSAAQQLFMAALHKIAVQTDSANERNYVLTELAERSGKLQWEPIFEGVRARDLTSLSSLHLLEEMRPRINPQQAESLGTEPVVLQLAIDDEPGAYRFTMRHSILIVSAEKTAGDPALRLSRDTLNQLYIGKLKWSEALSSGLIRCSNTCSDAETVLATIE
jgi:linear primary-alkylsulfatase